MKGLAVSFRGGRKTRSKNQVVLEFKGVTNRAGAGKLVGKTVVWKTPSGKSRNGKITRIHGGKGRVVARFERNVSGKILMQKVLVK